MGATSQAVACHQQQGTGQPDVASASTLLHTFGRSQCALHTAHFSTHFCPYCSYFAPLYDPPNCGANIILTGDQLRMGVGVGWGGGGVMSRMQVAVGSVLGIVLHLSILYSDWCTNYFTN